MQRHPGLPVELPVAGRPVLVVGGGPQALGKVALLRAGEAEVTVVAAQAVTSIADLADRGLIRWERRELQIEDLDGTWLVIAATGDGDADAAVTRVAATRQRFCLPGSFGVPAEPVGGPAAAAATAADAGQTGSTVQAAGRTGGTGSVAERPGGGVGGGRDGGGWDGRAGRGRVVLVGGGPGDAGLLTLAGLAAVRAADVVVHDRLAPLAVLDQVRPGTQIIDVAKVPRGATTPQEEINRLLVDHALAGRTVVRLKGGDNFVFGRGGEEWQACADAGIEVRVIPGVSSALAVPALAGIPLTHRTANHGFTVITGHVPPGDPRSMLDYPALARSGTALVVLMGVANLGAIASALIDAGMDAGTPAATVADGSLPGQRTVRASLSEIAAATTRAGIRAPAITVIGSVAAFDPASVG